METLTEYFLQQGVLGVIIVMLIGVIVWQQRRIDTKDTQITELQNKRVEDTNAYTNGYTNTIKEVISTRKDMVNAQIMLQKSVDALATALSNYFSKK